MIKLCTDNTNFVLVESETIPEGLSELTNVSNWLPLVQVLNIDKNLTHQLIKRALQVDPDQKVPYPAHLYQLDNDATEAAQINGYIDLIRVERQCREYRYDMGLAIIKKQATINQQYGIMLHLLQNLSGLIQLYKEANLLGVCEGDPIEGIVDFVKGTPGTSFELTNLAAFSPNVNTDTIRNVLVHGVFSTIKG